MKFFQGESRLYTNPKLIGLSPPAFKLMVFSWGWAADHETDGHIPDTVLPILGARTRTIRELVDAGLWHRNGTGHVIHDWLDHQPSKAQLDERRRQVSDRVGRHRAKRKEGRP